MAKTIQYSDKLNIQHQGWKWFRAVLALQLMFILVAILVKTF